MEGWPFSGWQFDMCQVFFLPQLWLLTSEQLQKLAIILSTDCQILGYCLDVIEVFCFDISQHTGKVKELSAKDDE